MSYLSQITATALAHSHSAFANMRVMTAHCLECAQFGRDNSNVGFYSALIDCQIALLANPAMKKSTAARWIKRTEDLLHMIKKKHWDNEYILKFVQANNPETKDACLNVIFSQFHIHTIEDARIFVLRGGDVLGKIPPTIKKADFEKIRQEWRHNDAIKANNERISTKSRIEELELNNKKLESNFEFQKKISEDAQKELVKFFSQSPTEYYCKMDFENCFLHKIALDLRIKEL